MINEPPEDLQPSSFDRFWWWKSNNTLFSFLLLLIVGGLILWLYRPLFETVSTTESLKTIEKNPYQSVLSFGAVSKDKLYYVDIPNGGFKTTDIFVRSINSSSSSIVVNLTKSPDYFELFPVLSPTTNHLAFFAIDQNSHHSSLRILELNSIGNSGGSPLEITANSLDSDLGSKCQISFNRPPQWSPDGFWVSFLAECKDNTVELFIAPINGSGVKKVSQSKNRVTEFYWFDQNSVIYTEKHEGDSATIHRGFISITSVVSKSIVDVHIPIQN